MTVSAYISGFVQGNTVYMNADQIVLALYKAGYHAAASTIEKAAREIAKQAA